VVLVAVLFGIQLLVHGVIQLTRAVATPLLPAAGRWALALLGLLGVVVGVLCLRHPLQTVVVLTLLLGLFWLVEGLAEIVGAVLDGVATHVLALLGGVAGAVAGLVVLVWPHPSALVLAVVFGLWLVLYGSLAIVRGWRGEG
jgi:uncharacterized membrane protein HdeD (DUF308 family)